MCDTHQFCLTIKLRRCKLKQLFFSLLMIGFLMCPTKSAISQDFFRDYTGDFDIEGFAETVPYLDGIDQLARYLNSSTGPNNLDLDLDGYRDLLGITVTRGKSRNERKIIVEAILQPTRDAYGNFHEQRVLVCDVLIRRVGRWVQVEVFGDEMVFGEPIYLYRMFRFPTGSVVYHSYGLDSPFFYSPEYCGMFFLVIYEKDWYPYHCRIHWRMYQPVWPWYYTRARIVYHDRFYDQVVHRKVIRMRARPFKKFGSSRFRSGVHRRNAGTSPYLKRNIRIRRSNPIYHRKDVRRRTIQEGRSLGGTNPSYKRPVRKSRSGARVINPPSRNRSKKIVKPRSIIRQRRPAEKNRRKSVVPSHRRIDKVKRPATNPRKPGHRVTRPARTTSRHDKAKNTRLRSDR